MAILVDSNTKVLIQGITGKSGLSACADLLAYGMKVVGGVTPGKGGQEVMGLPVFNSVKELVDALGPVDWSMVIVPPLLTLDAAMEAMHADIPSMHIFAERVPVLDTCKILYRAKEKKVRVLGPNSVGVISPGEGKIGSIGGPNAKITFSKGPVGVISKSGGMCSELGAMITNAGFGQSSVVGIGGDLLVGTTFVDALEMFEKDSQTKVVVAFGEVGGNAEIDAARMVAVKKFTKPLIVFLAGKFAEKLPKDTALGHAGAIVGLESTMEEKIKILKNSGALLAENFEDIPVLIKKSL